MGEGGYGIYDAISLIFSINFFHHFIYFVQLQCTTFGICTIFRFVIITFQSDETIDFNLKVKSQCFFFLQIYFGKIAKITQKVNNFISMLKKEMNFSFN